MLLCMNPKLVVIDQKSDRAGKGPHLLEIDQTEYCQSNKRNKFRCPA